MPIASVPEPHGIYPLTLFDDISTSTGIVLGWLVEGLVDVDLLSAALDRLLPKWPTLSGRLEPAPGKNACSAPISGSFYN